MEPKKKKTGWPDRLVAAAKKHGEKFASRAARSKALEKKKGFHKEAVFKEGTLPVHEISKNGSACKTCGKKHK